MWISANSHLDFVSVTIRRYSRHLQWLIIKYNNISSLVTFSKRDIMLWPQNLVGMALWVNFAGYLLLAFRDSYPIIDSVISDQL